MVAQFQKATKKLSKLRLAIDGPSGSGKTYTALIAATAIAESRKGKIAVIDTEHGSASLYSDVFDFDVLELTDFSPRNYVEAIHAAESAGYPVIVIDSLSHAWDGEGGALDLVDKAAKRSQSGNSFTAWKDVTPLQREMIDAILGSTSDIIATMRSKMDYVQEKDERTGNTTIRKVGMARIQRQGMEYEFTVVADMDIGHNLIVSKSRISKIADAIIQKPNGAWFKQIVDWLNDGTPENKTTEHKPEPEQPASAQPVQSPAPANGHKRPYPPELIKRKIEATSKELEGKELGKNDRNMIAVNVEMCFAPDPNSEEMRHGVLKYLTGTAHVKELTPAQVLALKKWIDAKPDSGGEFLPNADSAKEAMMIWQDHLKSQGQEPLI